MTHRSDLEWIDSTRPLDEIIAQVKESYHSKFPVSKRVLDEIQGPCCAGLAGRGQQPRIQVERCGASADHRAAKREAFTS
jgi:hypothetical protein